jgi:pyridoxine 5-phosphate synthase
MRTLILELDGLPSLREAMAASDIDLPAAATLAELAGVDAVRLGVNPDLKPVREEDVRDARFAARRLELRMPPAESLLKVALDVRPDRVLLATDGREGRPAAAPLDLRVRVPELGPVVRTLVDAGIPVAALVAPRIDAVKKAHAEGLSGIELFTGALVDLPAQERRSELEQLGDATRLASKLHLSTASDRLRGDAASNLRRARAVGVAIEGERWRAPRAGVLVGLDRALRDLRALVA